MNGLIRHARIVSLGLSHRCADDNHIHHGFIVTSWKNTELRSYTFVDGGEYGLYLKETPEPTLDERFRLRDESIQSWIKWGVIS